MRTYSLLVVALWVASSTAGAQVPPGPPLNGPPPGQLAPAPGAEAPSTTPAQDDAEANGSSGSAEDANGLEQPSAAGLGELDLEQWSRDDWMLLKPRVALLEVDGYLRLQARTLRRLDLGNGAAWEVDPRTADGAYRRFDPLDDGAANVNWTAMRLRIEPVININEQLQIITTLDLLDNLTLGSTPNTLAFGQTRPPLSILTRKQVVPSPERNALTQMLAVKRLWGRATALGEQLELRFGRMPDHWGLGILYNDGDGLGCDDGTVVDRVSLAFRLYGHVFTPMVDWVSKGIQTRPFGTYDPAPIDAVSWDDTMQYALRISREDHPTDIRDATLHGSTVVNYGMSHALRLQPRQFGTAFWGPGYTPDLQPTAASPVERRDASLYIGDAFFKLYRGHLEVLGEMALQAGSFTDTVVGSSAAQPGPSAKNRILMAGGALEARYFVRADRQGTQLSLLGGAASGDGHAGFGGLDLVDTQRGGDGAPGDRTLHNFAFSPDYHVDLLLFRRLMGTVTDAWYVRPELAYRFHERLEGALDVLYAQAVRPSSTASGTQRPLGLELDAHLRFGLPSPSQRGQLHAGLDGGILFPLRGFDNPGLPVAARHGKFAWTVAGTLALTF